MDNFLYPKIQRLTVQENVYYTKLRAIGYFVQYA